MELQVPQGEDEPQVVPENEPQVEPEEPQTEAFVRESGCPVGTDSEDLSHVGIQKIVRDLIINRQFDDATRTLNETMTPIRVQAFLLVWPRVHFMLEQQEMIELCRRRDYNAALDFSRKFVMWENVESELDSFSFRKECRSTLLLMLFGDDKDSPGI